MRLIAYVRVSSREQVEGYSLDEQRIDIREFCTKHDHELVREFADEGISAHSDSLKKRPGFRDAIAFVKSGRADGIIVHKQDRIARNVYVFLHAAQEIDGQFVCVKENFDFSSPGGKMQATVLAAAAQYFSDNLAQEVRKGQQGRRRANLPQGKPPFGLKKPKNPREFFLRDDEPVLCTIADRRQWSRYDALLFILERCAAGAPLAMIASELYQIGFRITGPGIRHIVLNRFYVGELPIEPIMKAREHREGWRRGTHEPYVDPDLFERSYNYAQRAYAERRKRSVARGRRTRTFSGTLECGRCGGPMQTSSPGGYTNLMCYKRHHFHSCTQPYVSQRILEKQVRAELVGLEIPREWIEALLEPRKSRDRAAARSRETMQAQLRRIADLYAWGHIDAAQYQRRHTELIRELEALNRPDVEQHAEWSELMHRLVDLWDAGDEVAKNDLLHLLFDRIIIDGRDLSAIVPTQDLLYMQSYIDASIVESSSRRPWR
jgi:site-specific DNA recombinase